MKILVICSNYPNAYGCVSHMYVHIRNKFYVDNGIEVTVLNFKTQIDYIYEGIKVISLKSYNKEKNNYDILLSHAPNLRKHFRFLLSNNSRFKKKIFFFHGHEILKINQVYPEPYSFVKKNSKLKKWIQNCYDSIKLLVWRKYFLKNKDKIELVFVSNWLYNQFKKNIIFEDKQIEKKIHIINNSVGSIFENNIFNVKQDKQYDVITIRSNLDASKYCIDLVMKLAENNPKLKFLVVGRGKYFSYNDRPQNVTWMDCSLKHQEMIELLNEARASILLTRQDTQGVIACEMATFGIPLISSNIEVCQEILGKMKNVELIDNSNMNIDLNALISDMYLKYYPEKQTDYFADKTINKEVNLILS